MTRDELHKDIDRRIDIWHDADMRMSVYEFLGWTKDEYFAWGTNSENLPEIELLRLSEGESE